MKKSGPYWAKYPSKKAHYLCAAIFPTDCFVCGEITVFFIRYWEVEGEVIAEIGNCPECMSENITITDSECDRLDKQTITNDRPFVCGENIIPVDFKRRMRLQSH